MEDLAAKPSDDRTDDKQAFYKYLGQIERLIEFVAFLLVLVTTALLCALYGRQIAACIGLGFSAAILLWRRRRIRTEHQRRTTT
jgi:hypothetical protein